MSNLKSDLCHPHSKFEGHWKALNPPFEAQSEPSTHPYVLFPKLRKGVYEGAPSKNLTCRHPWLKEG